MRSVTLAFALFAVFYSAGVALAAPAVGVVEAYRKSLEALQTSSYRVSSNVVETAVGADGHETVVRRQQAEYTVARQDDRLAFDSTILVELVGEAEVPPIVRRSVVLPGLWLGVERGSRGAVGSTNPSGMVADLLGSSVNVIDGYPAGLDGAWLPDVLAESAASLRVLPESERPDAAPAGADWTGVTFASEDYEVRAWFSPGQGGGLVHLVVRMSPTAIRAYNEASAEWRGDDGVELQGVENVFEDFVYQDIGGQAVAVGATNLRETHFADETVTRVRSRYERQDTNLNETFGPETFAMDLPAGTPVFVPENKSGVRYVWDGAAIVADVDPFAGETVGEAVVESRALAQVAPGRSGPSAIWIVLLVLGIVAAVGAVAVVWSRQRSRPDVP